MALPVCLEVVIRLLLALARFLFGDVSLIWKEGVSEYLVVGLPTMFSNAVFFALIIIVGIFFKQAKIRNAILFGLPAVINAAIDFGAPVSGGLTQAFALFGAFVTAICWAAVALFDEQMNPVMRFAAIPAMVILGFINSLWPISIIGDAIGYLGFTFLAEFMGIIVLVIFGALIIFSPSFVCGTANEYLIFAADWRNQGFWGAITMLFGILFFVPKKLLIHAKKKL